MNEKEEKIRKGFYKTLWGIISEHIPHDTVITGEEIFKLCWKYAPMETKEALEQYNSGNYNFSFNYYIMRALSSTASVINK